MKFNIPKIKNITDKINNIKSKINDRKENNVKIQPRYYGLLLLMILLGVVTVAANIKTYNDITGENYRKYEIAEDIETDAEDVEILNYETAISSISTNVSNVQEEKKDTNRIKEKVVEYIWPVDGEVIREYAKDSLIYSKTMDMWLIHIGIDIAANIGCEVKSIADGRVIMVESNNFYGNVVKIEHEDGYVSIYANLGEDNLPKINQKIDQGEVIGKIGDTAYGESAEESHLHFEITKDETSINPEEFLIIRNKQRN